MKDPQHPADDGEAQGDEQVNGPENEGVDENNLEGFPHILVSPFSPKEGSLLQKSFPLSWRNPESRTA
jgi:hypothetical protein